MMDKSSVELRRHLVETADEVVPADQLETIRRRVATVPQQAPWFVRLRWLVSPVAPSANAGVRAAVLATAALLLVTSTVAVIGVGGSQPSGSPFEGRWTSIDPGDGSTQTLLVEPGETPAVHYEDAFSMHCHLNDDSSVLFLADGAGEVQSSRLVVSFPGGGCVTWQVPGFVTTYNHDSINDTLLDGDGAIWRRVEEPSTAP